MGPGHLDTLELGKGAFVLLFAKDIGRNLDVRHTILTSQVVYSA